jgi:hypothetical protein
VFIQQQVILTEMAAAHMPMKILRLEIESEDIGQQHTKALRNLRTALMPARGRPIAFAPLIEICYLCFHVRPYKT